MRSCRWAKAYTILLIFKASFDFDICHFSKRASLSEIKPISPNKTGGFLRTIGSAFNVNTDIGLHENRRALVCTTDGCQRSWNLEDGQNEVDEFELTINTFSNIIRPSTSRFETSFAGYFTLRYYT